jgi:hypothetical protein
MQSLASAAQAAAARLRVEADGVRHGPALGEGGRVSEGRVREVEQVLHQQAVLDWHLDLHAVLPVLRLHSMRWQVNLLHTATCTKYAADV